MNRWDLVQCHHLTELNLLLVFPTWSSLSVSHNTLYRSERSTLKVATVCVGSEGLESEMQQRKILQHPIKYYLLAFYQLSQRLVLIFWYKIEYQNWVSINIIHLKLINKNLNYKLWYNCVHVNFVIWRTSENVLLK